MACDSDQRPLWEKQFVPNDLEYKFETVDRIVLEDLGGDERKEILFNHLPPTAQDPSSTMAASGRTAASSGRNRSALPGKIR